MLVGRGSICSGISIKLTTNLLLDKNLVKRIQDIQVLDSENKTHLFALMDAFLRDYKAKQAYST